MIYAPSIATLTRTFQIDRPTAILVRKVIKGQVDPCSVSTAANQRRLQAYHPHAKYVLKLEALNQILGLYGVEYVPKGSNQRSPGFEYLNTGDSYAPTIVRFDGGGYRISSWGDIVERGNYA